MFRALFRFLCLFDSFYKMFPVYTIYPIHPIYLQYISNTYIYIYIYPMHFIYSIHSVIISYILVYFCHISHVKCPPPTVLLQIALSSLDENCNVKHVVFFVYWRIYLPTAGRTDGLAGKHRVGPGGHK